MDKHRVLRTSQFYSLVLRVQKRAQVNNLLAMASQCLTANTVATPPVSSVTLNMVKATTEAPRSFPNFPGLFSSRLQGLLEVAATTGLA